MFNPWQGIAGDAGVGMTQDLFEYHRPSAYQLFVLTQLRKKASELADLVQYLLPPGRCRSLALTKLEEQSMWANKACVFELDACPDWVEPTE